MNRPSATALVSKSPMIILSFFLSFKSSPATTNTTLLAARFPWWCSLHLITDLNRKRAIDIQVWGALGKSRGGGRRRDQRSAREGGEVRWGLRKGTDHAVFGGVGGARGAGRGAQPRPLHRLVRLVLPHGASPPLPFLLLLLVDSSRARALSLSLLSRGEGRDQIGERRKRRGSGESNGRRIAMVIRRGGGGGGMRCDAMGETAPLQPCGKPRAAVRCGMDG